MQPVSANEWDVAQTSKSAVSRVSKLADAPARQNVADLEIGDTAGLETCATGLRIQNLIS
jgi:hypothetical protein